MGNEASVLTMCCAPDRGERVPDGEGFGPVFGQPRSLGGSLNYEVERALQDEGALSAAAELDGSAADAWAPSAGLRGGALDTSDLLLGQLRYALKSSGAQEDPPGTGPRSSSNNRALSRSCLGGGPETPNATEAKSNCLVATIHTLRGEVDAVALWRAERLSGSGRRSTGRTGVASPTRRERFVLLGYKAMPNKTRVTAVQLFTILGNQVLVYATLTDGADVALELAVLNVSNDPGSALAVDISAPPPPPPPSSSLSSLSVPCSGDPVVSLEVCESLSLLVGATAAGALVFARVEAAVEDAVVRIDNYTFPLARSVKDCLSLALLGTRNARRPLVGLFVRPSPEDSSRSSMSIFEGGPGDASQQQTADILVVQQDGQAEVLRINGTSFGEALGPLLSFEFGDALNGRCTVFTKSTVPMRETHSHRRPSTGLPAGKASKSAHAFSVLFLAGVTKDRAHVLSMWDLRSPEVQLVRQFPLPAGSSAQALCFGPFLNGPIVFAAENGVLHVLDVEGHVIKRSSTLAGRRVIAAFCELNRGIWCITNDGGLACLT